MIHRTYALRLLLIATIALGAIVLLAGHLEVGP